MATSTASSPPTAVFQLRTERELLQEVKDLAAKRQVSTNRFLVNAIKASLQQEKEQEKEREWREGFEAMGRDPDTNNVEYMLPAAREVVFGS